MSGKDKVISGQKNQIRVDRTNVVSESRGAYDGGTTSAKKNEEKSDDFSSLKLIDRPNAPLS